MSAGVEFASSLASPPPPHLYNDDDVDDGDGYDGDDDHDDVEDVERDDGLPHPLHLIKEKYDDDHHFGS